MSLFEPIEITWKGDEKTVEAEKVMRVLAKLEDEITFVEANQLVAEAMNSGSRKQIRVATTYANFLKSCGFKVTPGEVIETLDFAAYVACLVEIINVLKLTLAPAERERYQALMDGAEVDEPEKEPEPKKTPAAKRSRKKSTAR